MLSDIRKGDLLVAVCMARYRRETIDIACDKIVKALDLALADLKGK